MNKYDIHSSEKLYQVADELQSQMDSCDDYDEKLRLNIECKSIASLIRTYERISKGSFIDDLIKEQQERETDSQNPQTKDTAYNTPQTQPTTKHRR